MHCVHTGHVVPTLICVTSCLVFRVGTTFHEINKDGDTDSASEILHCMQQEYHATCTLNEKHSHEKIFADILAVLDVNFSENLDIFPFCCFYHKFH